MWTSNKPSESELLWKGLHNKSADVKETKTSSILTKIQKRNFYQKGKQNSKYHNCTENASYISSWIDQFKLQNFFWILSANRGLVNVLTETDLMTSICFWD